VIIIKILLAYIGNLLDVSFAILPILLVAAMFGLKSFKKNAALQFFIITAGVFLGWRTLFCFYNGGGISDRYIMILPLLFTVPAVAGIPVLSRWLVRLLAWKNIKVREQTVVWFCLIVISAISLGKALNPPDRKPYVHEIADYLKSHAGDGALMIDATADGGRIVFMGDLKVENRGVSKFSRNHEMFLKEFKAVMADPANAGRRIFLCVRVSSPDEFVTACRTALGGFPFVSRYSSRIKKDTVLLYEKIETPVE